MSFFSTKEKAFGLDISDQTLRFVQMGGRPAKPQIKSYNEIRLPAGCVVNGQIKQPQIFIDHLKKLAKTKSGRGQLSREAVVVLPEAGTFLKSLSIEAADAKELPDKIKEALPKEIPLELEEIYFDWEIADKKPGHFQVLAGVSPKQTVDEYLDIISQAGITPVVLDLEAIAIAQLLIDQNGDHQPKIIIDIGQNRTGLFLYDGNNIQFSVSLPLSGNYIDTIIAEALDLTMEQAEEAKITCGFDSGKCHGALIEVLDPAITDLTSQINGAIDFYENSFDASQKISEIILCGGGANMINLAKVLNQQTGLSTTVSEPFKTVKNPDPEFFTSHRSQSFVTAIGLGLRGLKPQTFYDHA